MSDPRLEYTRRTEAHRGAVTKAALAHDRLANARLAVFALGIAGVLVGARFHVAGWYAAAGAALGFVALAVLHERVLRARRAAEAGVRWYEAGLARLAGRWQGQGDDGLRFLPADHPYARDLDVLGPGSLFQYLNAARTASGAAALARWLCAPAAPESVAARQAAVAELRGRLDLREDLARLSDEMASRVYPELLGHWAARPVSPRLDGLQQIASVVTAVNVVGVAAALGMGAVWPFAGALVIATFAYARLGALMRDELAAIEEPLRELPTLAQALARFEREHFDSPLLAGLQARLALDGTPASAAIGRLVRLVWRIEQQRNAMLALFLGLVLWGIHGALAIQRWRRQYGPHVAGWIDALGALEALCSIARYAFEHPTHPFPEVTPDDTPRFAARALGHPLLPPDRCVRNDVTLDATLRLFVVSGSNMSGKSTFLRSIGANAVLAQAGAPVCAASLHMTPAYLVATMHVQDSIQEGASRFYAELQRIRQAVDLAARGPVLFLFDEILHGTNSHDRRIGAEALLGTLLSHGALGLVTTHDLALASLAESLPEPACNVHFDDRFEDGKLVFDYRLKPGVVEHSNALALMASLGLIQSAG